MKKLAIFTFIIALIIIPHIVYAQTENSDFSNITEDFEDFSIKNFEYDFSEISDALKRGNIKEILSEIKNFVFYELKTRIVNHNNIMLTIISILLFSTIIKQISTDEILKTVSISIICLISSFVISTYISVYKIVFEAIEDMFDFLKISIPVYIGISASVLQKMPIATTFFLGFISLFYKIFVNFLLPMVTLSVILTMLSGINSQIDFKKTRGSIISLINWVTGISSTLFISALKIMQIASYTSDKVIYSGIKYTVSHAIPVVGGFVSDTLGTVINSLMVIHNSIGITSVVILLVICAVPVTWIFLVSFFLKIISCIFEPISHSEITDLIYNFGVCIGELAIILLMTVVSFVIGISLMLNSIW